MLTAMKRVLTVFLVLSKRFRLTRCRTNPLRTGIILKDTKTASSTRTVSIPDNVVNLFKKHSAQQSAEKLKMGSKWFGANNTEEENHDYVFTTFDGHLAHPHSINTFLKKFTAEHGLINIGIHAFRHMNATFLITAGVDIRTVAGKLGHARPSITMDIYSHLVKSAEQETANIMGNLLQDLTTKAKTQQKKKA